MRTGVISVAGLLSIAAAMPVAAQTAAPAAATAATSSTTATPSSTRSLSDAELAAAVERSLGPAGIVPAGSGFNASLITSSQYDSITGWANVLTPSVAYRFNRYLSADIATPLFLYLRSEQTVAPARPGVAALTVTTVRHGVPGDTTMAAHLSSRSFGAGRLGDLSDIFTASLSAPTGSVEDGIGAGKTTFTLTNHLQSYRLLAPYIDLGIGTTSRLQNRRLQRSQTSRGVLANFGAGISLELPRRSIVYLEGYEQLPMGAQTVYQVDPRNGRPEESQTVKGLAEDNGINLSIDVPLLPHVTWSGYYSRGLRLHEDTVGFAFTFLLRKPANSPSSR